MAFFYIMKNTYFILLISLTLTYYNYDQDDWIILYEPDNIKSITEDSFNLHFLADNGIFSYDYMEEYFYYNKELSHDLPINERCHYIYYHPIMDYFFIITDYQILYRPSVSFHWNSINLSSFNIYSFSNINKIGFSDNFLVIKSDNNNLKIDLYTMNIIDNDIFSINVNWLSYLYNDINLSQFYSFDNTIIGSNQITDNSRINHIVNCYYYDKNEDLWIGMNTGAIYKVSYFSHQIERINIGPRIDNISGLYDNGQNIWYFFDKYFRRTGASNVNNFGYFLSIWNKNDNSWLHIPKNDNLLISNSIINEIFEINQFVFLLTLNGFLIFDLKSESWYHSYDFLKSSDRSLWVARNNNNKLYIGTASGLVIADFKLIDNKPNIYYDNTILKDSEIYDIEIRSNQVYIASNNGLYSYNIQNQALKLLDLNIYYNIELNNDDILVSNKDLWIINDSDRELISFNVESFKVSDSNTVCASNYQEIKIINLQDNNEWYLNLGDSNNIIYSLDCDENWLWFTNSEGLLFFKWSNYE